MKLSGVTPKAEFLAQERHEITTATDTGEDKTIYGYLFDWGILIEERVYLIKDTSVKNPAVPPGLTFFGTLSPAINCRAIFCRPERDFNFSLLGTGELCVLPSIDHGFKKGAHPAGAPKRANPLLSRHIDARIASKSWIRIVTGKILAAGICVTLVYFFFGFNI